MIKLSMLLPVSVLIVLLAGCTPIKSVDPALPALTLDESAMLQLVKQRQNSYQTLSTLAQVKIVKNDKKWSTTQAILVEEPNRLRLDMLNFFGQLMLQMVVDGSTLSAYVPSESTLYSGAALQQNIQRFTGLPLPVTDIVALLLNKLPMGVLETGTISSWEHGLLVSVNDSVLYKLTITNQHVVEVEYSVNEYVVYRVAYTEFMQQNNKGEDQYPHKIQLEVPLNNVVVNLRFDDTELNTVFTPQQFILQLPQSTIKKELSEL